MVTTYPPQLNHIGFDWFVQSNRFHRELLARESRVLNKLGFFAEYGDPADPGFTGHIEAMALMNEISGIISVAATIRMDAGFKAPNRIIATLKAIGRDPSLIFTHAVEPEALGSLALSYQRGEEQPGTFWFDIDRPANAPLPGPDRVRAAASRAIALLKIEASPGRRKDEAVGFLAHKFREMFLRFNDRITRHSIATCREVKKIRQGEASPVKGRLETVEIQKEAGPFIEFLELVLEPLNLFFRGLPKDYGATQISAGYVAERLRDRQGKQPPQDIGQRGSLARMPNCPHNFHREFRGFLRLNRPSSNMGDSQGDQVDDRLHRGALQETP